MHKSKGQGCETEAGRQTAASDHAPPVGHPQAGVGGAAGSRRGAGGLGLVGKSESEFPRLPCRVATPLRTL